VSIQQARFIQVFEYWGEKAEIGDELEYLVCVIQERLPLLTERIHKLITSNSYDQLFKLFHVVTRTSGLIMKVDPELKLFVEMGLHNMYYRPLREPKKEEKLKYAADHGYVDFGEVSSVDIPVFSCRF